MRISMWNRGLKVKNSLLPSVLLVGGAGIGLVGCDTQPAERTSGYYYEKQAVSDGRLELGEKVNVVAKEGGGEKGIENSVEKGGEQRLNIGEAVGREAIVEEIAHSIELAQFVEAGAVDEVGSVGGGSDDGAAENIHLEAESHTFHFGFDKIALDESALETLQHIAALVESYPTAIIVVDGHADRQGDEQYNRFLSQQRADQVVKQLMQHGVPSDNFVIRSYGSTEANDDNRSSRRVELSIMSAEVYAHLHQDEETSMEMNIGEGMEENIGENGAQQLPVEKAQLDDVIQDSAHL